LFVLKEYQQRALDALREYFEVCVKFGNADDAFYHLSKEFFGTGIPYRMVMELPGLPYVCIRIPTGGGKTVVACHGVGVTAKYLLYSDNPVVLWLVPSNTIREQTLKALRDRSHPYRKALDSTVGTVNILDILEALYVQRPTLDEGTTIIVSTMQAFRVEDTDGRRVYDFSGELMGHFTDIDSTILRSLERSENGVLIQSLANVLRLRRPIVIVDEAHNARTGLSFETLARFNPSCIIEFTATPDTKNNPSNVLYTVSAAELKAEEMIKMPIRLETRSQWKELLADAIGLRSRLEKTAEAEQQETGEYIRPIMLIQAQPRRKDADTITVEVVKQCLLDDFKIPEKQVVVATGSEKGLEGVDILSSKCEIRFVITVQALREGWDCPFAYILFSVAEQSSSTAVEQILGRILRLPKAKWKVHGELNMAYAFVTSERFSDAANSLTDALVQNGFERQEARDLITEIRFPSMGSLFDESGMSLDDSVTVTVPEAPKLEGISDKVAEKISFDPGVRTITFLGVMDDVDRVELKKCFSTIEGKAAVERIYMRTRGLSVEGKRSPSERGGIFSIPVLAFKQGSIFEQFEETHFLDIPWHLSKCNTKLTEREFSSSTAKGQHGEITVSDKGKLEAKFISNLQEQMTILAEDYGWSVPELAYWLDRKIHHPDITHEESGIFLLNLVRYLIEDREITLDKLVHGKYRLRQAVAKKIEEHRKNALRSNYQSVLFQDFSILMVAPELCFSFEPLHYPFNTRYQGKYKFVKHYYPEVGDLKDKGEEFECAQFIDLLPEVKFWVRNLDRRPNCSFWLQTSSDKFYPDFVCLLNDGRYLVIEYKGEDRWSNDDSKEKRDVGGLWEARSGGKCLFIMPKGKNFGAIKEKIV
jgi:type III restriction enzyme